MDRFSSGASHGGEYHLVIVGREREQAILRQALDEMLTGHGSLVLVSGEAGIGKTTLVEWLATQAKTRGALVLRGGCYDLMATPPYGPWSELLRAYHPDDDGPPLPEFVIDPAAFERVGSQHALFDQSTQFFHKLAERKATILVLEDLHWADSGSIDFLRFLARQTRQDRLLIVATHRSDELPPQHPLSIQLPLLVRESGAQRIELRPLDKTGQRALIRARYELTIADQKRLESYLEAQAEGNPLFAIELLRTLEEGGALRQEGSSWLLDDLGEVTVPSLLRHVIEGRLARLGDDARDRLAEAAVIGQEVPLTLWVAVTGAPELDLLIIMERAIEARLLDPAEHGARFTHAVIRETIYDGVLPVRRRVWHRQIADVLLSQPDPDPDFVAYHLQEADDERAVDWMIKAGDRAERSYSWLTAADRLATASDLLASNADANSRALLLARVAVLRRYADPQGSLDAMNEAHRIATALGDRLLTAYTLMKCGLLQCWVGSVRLGLDMMADGVEVFDSLPPAERARAISLRLDVGPDNDRGTLVEWLSSSGQFREALEQYSRISLEPADAVEFDKQKDAVFGDALMGMCDALLALGKPAEALDAFRRATQHFRNAQHPAQICWSSADVLRRVVLPYFGDNLALRRQLALDSEEAARRAGTAIADLPPRHALMPLMAIEGNWVELRNMATVLLETVHPKQFRSVGSSALGNVAFAQGDFDVAWSMVQSFLPAGPGVEPGDDLYFLALEEMRLAVRLSLHADDLTQARAWLETHDHWLDWAGAKMRRADCALLWAHYFRQSGDTESARQKAREAFAWAEEPRQPLALIAIHRFLGQVKRDTQHLSEAETHLNESLQLASACAAPFERALTLLELAKLRVAQGRHEDARTLLDDVRSICEPLGARPTLAAVDDLSRTMPSSTRSQSSFPAGLTRREGEVLGLVAQGHQ